MPLIFWPQNINTNDSKPVFIFIQFTSNEEKREKLTDKVDDSFLKSDETFCSKNKCLNKDMLLQTFSNHTQREVFWDSTYVNHSKFNAGNMYSNMQHFITLVLLIHSY